MVAAALPLLAALAVGFSSVAPVQWRCPPCHAPARGSLAMAATGQVVSERVQQYLELSRDQLRSQCSTRSLRISGTKLALAERLAGHHGGATKSRSAPAAAVDIVAEPATPPVSEVADAAEPATPPASEVAAEPATPPASELVRPASSSSAAPAPPQQVAEPRPPVRNGRKAPPAAREVVAPTSMEPPVEDFSPTGSGADMELVVLGSGACNPSPVRSASSLAIRVRESYWLFDAGEGTQVQLQKCFVSPSRIDRIFVTHAHGDHCFGLPGLLCLIARGRDRDAPPMEIYGPAGLRAFLRVTLRFSGTAFLPRFVVHELHNIPFLHSSRPQQAPLAVSGDDVRAGDSGEQPGGRNLQPEEDGTWNLFRTPFGDDGHLTVRAAPVRHTAPTVGYVVEEEEKRGRLQPELILPLLERNRQRLRDEWGVRDPRTLMKEIKLLGAKDVMELPDGALIRGSDVVGETRRGRKVAVLGDCCDASLCARIAQGADILVHEATNAYLPHYGDTGGSAKLERETRSHGHSTPQMAGAVAASFGAKALLLNHFSQRYSPDAVGVMRSIHDLAVRQSKLPPERVVVARDTLVVPVWAPDRGKAFQTFLASRRPPEEREVAARQDAQQRSFSE